MRDLASALAHRARRTPRDHGPVDLARLPDPSDENLKAIPEADLISKQFDRESAAPPARMLVILSTPRSGSTYLCQLLHQSGLCTPHEYFQHEQYLPLAAYRWGCAEGGRVDWRRYAAALERHRTGESGVLGINLHGSHLRRYSEALPYFSARSVRYAWLQRRDKLRQAVSFGIAKQTGQWSIEFKRGAEPEYDHEFFRDRLRRIQKQEAFIHAFLELQSIDCETIYYEDFVRDPKSTLGLFGVDYSRLRPSNDRNLRKQANKTNDDFVHRLAADILRGAT
jgi:LPS sulfotransferase NodH